MANIESQGRGAPVRAKGHKRLKQRAWILLLMVGAGVGLMRLGGHTLDSMSFGATAPESRDQRQADWFVPSRPETVVWGWVPIDQPPVLTVQSGQTVRIDTLSHQGAMHDEDPVTVFGALGVKPEEILQDVIDFWTTRASRPTGAGRSAHILTGPIYIDGAEPGDMLEAQILELETRVPYGINSTSPTSGVLGPSYPGTLPWDPPPQGTRRLIRTAKVDGREVALFAEHITVPLGPFMGIMAVAPPAPVPGPPLGGQVPGGRMQSSRPPGPFGGNLDVKDLTAGSTLYLPVFQPGARFYVGDPHAAQGDGEVDGTAIEQSLTGTFRFILHKGKTIPLPRAETKTHYVMMGIDMDLNRAMRMATQEVVNFLVADKGLAPGDAYALASIACDFHVAEAVDLTQLVVGKVPKHIFKEP
jgi:acetamidase/formamidase